MSDLNTEISASFLEQEDIENKALQIESRINKITGDSKLLPKRRYGSPVSSEEIARNMTLSSLIAKEDRELAAYLNLGLDFHRKAEEEENARKLFIERTRLATEELMRKNQAAALHRERSFARGVNPTTGRPQI